MKQPWLWVGWLVLGSSTICSAQNVVSRFQGPRMAPPLEIAAEHARMLLDFDPGERPAGKALSPAALQIASRLDAHVAEFLDGWPWMPWHHTHGISGYESYFDHPDTLFHAMSLALPHLSPETGARLREFLAQQLQQSPPFAVEGYDRHVGRERESYDVPGDLRQTGRGRARSLFGVYAFEEYVTTVEDRDAAQRFWPQIRERVRPILRQPVDENNPPRDGAEVLNGNLAGLIGYIRLARKNRDGEAEQQALPRLVELLNQRVNLDRVNPQLLDRTAATRSLHLIKLARHCDLAPEIGHALARWTDGCAAANMRAFREARNGWYLAYGDRLIGGENYTSPPHLSRAMFAEAALVEQVPADDLFRWIDVPWCRGDFWFIEKSALALWRAKSAGDDSGPTSRTDEGRP